MGCITHDTLMEPLHNRNCGIKVKKTNCGAPYFDFGVVRPRRKLELLTPFLTALHCGT